MQNQDLQKINRIQEEIIRGSMNLDGQNFSFHIKSDQEIAQQGFAEDVNLKSILLIANYEDKTLISGNLQNLKVYKNTLNSEVHNNEFLITLKIKDNKFKNFIMRSPSTAFSVSKNNILSSEENLLFSSIYFYCEYNDAEVLLTFNPFNPHGNLNMVKCTKGELNNLIADYLLSSRVISVKEYYQIIAGDSLGKRI